MNRQQKNTTLVIFSERLKKAGRAAGFKNQEMLANAVGVSQAAVSKWENGTIPDSVQLIKLCEILHVSADWLLGRESVKYPPHQPFAMELRDSPEMLANIEKLLDDARQAKQKMIEAQKLFDEGLAELREILKQSKK